MPKKLARQRVCPCVQDDTLTSTTTMLDSATVTNSSVGLLASLREAAHLDHCFGSCQRTANSRHERWYLGDAIALLPSVRTILTAAY